MFKSINSKILAVSVCASLALAACDKSDDKPATSAAYTAADSLLNYIPADSPYVMASIEPLPDDVMDKLEPKIDRMLLAYQGMLEELVVMLETKAEAGDGDSADAEKAVAVIAEFSELMSMDGMRSAGFDRDSTMAIYGNGLLPVLRVELSDGALFEAALNRIEERAGERMDIATIAGNSVRYVVADDLKILVAILDKQLVVSMAPAVYTDEQLGSLLGFTGVGANIAEAGVLQQIAGEYGFNDYFVGYFDIAGIAETFISGPTGLDEDLFATFDEREPLSGVCQAEAREVAGIAPRVVMGYTGITPEQFDSTIVVEMREDLAAGLATIPAGVPGLGGDMGGLMSFGLSMNIKTMRDFVEARVEALEADPFECELFADLQDTAAQARMGLQQPTMPMVYDFRGFVGVIEAIEGLDLTTQAPPTSVDGQFLLAMDNAPALVSLGAMMNPQIAEIGIEPNGKPVRLNTPEAQMLGGEVFVAMTDDALAMSIGEGSESKLGDVLKAPLSEDGTFFNFSMDAGRYYEFMSEAIAAAEDDDENPMSPEFRAAMQEVMLAGADFYDRITFDTRFTEKGIVIDSTVLVSD